jgi:PAP2 superfamily
LLIAYPVITTVVVVATGNHFVTDAAGGLLLAGLVWVVIAGARKWLREHPTALSGHISQPRST